MSQREIFRVLTDYGWADGPKTDEVRLKRTYIGEENLTEFLLTQPAGHLFVVLDLSFGVGIRDGVEEDETIH